MRRTQRRKYQLSGPCHGEIYYMRLQAYLQLNYQRQLQHRRLHPEHHRHTASQKRHQHADARHQQHEGEHLRRQRGRYADLRQPPVPPTTTASRKVKEIGKLKIYEIAGDMNTQEDWHENAARISCTEEAEVSSPIILRRSARIYWLTRESCTTSPMTPVKKVTGHSPTTYPSDCTTKRKSNDST